MYTKPSRLIQHYVNESKDADDPGTPTYSTDVPTVPEGAHLQRSTEASPHCQTCGIQLKLFNCSKHFQEHVYQLILQYHQNSQITMEQVEKERELPVPNVDEYSLQEVVWESQTFDSEKQEWTNAELERYDMGRFSDFSGNVHARTQAGIISPLPFNIQYDWTGEWTVDLAEEGADEEGWKHDVDFQLLREDICINGETAPTAVVRLRGRRRKLSRTRRVGGTVSAWFAELLKISPTLTGLKQPMCHQCGQMALRNLENEIIKLSEEVEQYQAFQPNHTRASEADEALSLDELKQQKLDLEEQIKQCRLEKEAISAKRVAQQELADDLLALKGNILGESVAGELSRCFLLEERSSVGDFSSHASDTLQRLQRYNVCNDAFHIWHDGEFGTINGLRLGRLPNRPVEWVEINAALGQTTTLLSTIIDQADFAIPSCKLIPRGSFSKIVNADGREYPLHTDGSFLKRRGFNHGLVLLLECVDAVGKQAAIEDPSNQLPYKISKGKIGELSISLGDDQQWTKALKYMLTHLKWLLAWATRKSSPQQVDTFLH